jgi:prevent-host-death family protein
MVQVSAEEAGQRFESLLRQVMEGQSVEIVSGDRPVAVLVPAEPRKKPRFGSARDLFTVPDDFDEPLPDFEEYTR